MGSLISYAIWNNKGGVGKSTITFHLATRYAEQNPHKRVLVIDLCPQSNSSMMLLGGGHRGEQFVFNECVRQPVPRTVVGYLSTVISRGSAAPLPNPYEFLILPNSVNDTIPRNLLLMCGDGNLEPMAPAISQAANAPSLMPGVSPWLWVHRVFRQLIESLAQLDQSDLVVFIDTNPSFSIYTELAISAADRLLTPVNADDSSRTAAQAMFILLHGQEPPHPIYGQWTFAAHAAMHQLPIPQIHLIIGNRLTQHRGPAAAFQALSQATSLELYNGYIRRPEYFTRRQNQILDINDFQNNYSVPLRDFNTAGIVSAHLGARLSSMHEGRYVVHGDEVSIARASVVQCLDAIDTVVAYL